MTAYLLYICAKVKFLTFWNFYFIKAIWNILKHMILAYSNPTKSYDFLLPLDFYCYHDFYHKHKSHGFSWSSLGLILYLHLLPFLALLPTSQTCWTENTLNFLPHFSYANVVHSANPTPSTHHTNIPLFSCVTYIHPSVSAPTSLGAFRHSSGLGFVLWVCIPIG